MRCLPWAGRRPADRCAISNCGAGDKTITHFDVYDLLVFGDKSKDVALLPGDVIYIPPVGPQIAIAGSVNVPAIYEIKNEDLREALRLAGGLTAVAGVQQMSIERIEGHASRMVETLSLDAHGLEHEAPGRGCDSNYRDLAAIRQRGYPTGKRCQSGKIPLEEGYADQRPDSKPGDAADARILERAK